MAKLTNAQQSAQSVLPGPGWNQIQLAVANAVQQIPNWQTLFGSLSFCDCGHCRSAYGPAAYFVDLLQFLRYPSSGVNDAGLSPQDVLFRRRPDLQYIKLTCENSETPLPYVDLVNEILETYVALGRLDASAAHDTGDSTAEDLRANPQYINETAYDTVKEAIYPFTLPFNRALEVARIYLEHLGSSRELIMRAFQKGSDPSDPTKGAPSNLAIDCECLRISPEEHSILTGTDLAGSPIPSPPGLSEFYGYDAKTSATDLLASLQQVPTFLQKTAVSYVNLAELMKTHFINPNQAITLDVPPDADPCDLTKTTISNLSLDPDALERMHRFIRLWKKMGWEVRDLDKTMRALNASDIDNTFLSRLAHLKRLETELHVPLGSLLVFWNDIDTEGRDSLYLKLFQNKSVLKPVDHDFELKYSTPLAAAPNISLPDSPTDRISYHSPTNQLRLAGGLTAEERDLLLSLSAAAAYQAAIQQLYGNQAGGIGVSLATMPGLAFSASPKDKISYDPATKQLRFTGSMTPQERTLLLSLSTDATYRLAIDNLFQMRWSAGIELAILSADPSKAKISTHSATILAGLRLSAVGLAALTLNPGGELADDDLTLANLSKLFRFATLAKALRLSANDLLSLKKLSGIDPFQPGSPASTVTFVKMAGKVRQSPFSMAQLDYLYRHVYDPSRGVASLQANVDLLLKTLQAGLRKIVGDTTVAPDPTGEILRQKLGVVLDSGSVDSTMALSDGTAVYSTPLPVLPNITFPSPLNSKIAYDGKAQRLRFTGAMTDAENAILSSLAKQDAGYQTAISNLFQAPRDFISTTLKTFLPDQSDAISQIINNAVTPADRFNYVLTHLMVYMRATLSRSLIEQTMGDSVKLGAGLTDLLLETLLRSRSDPGRPAIADFLALADGGLSASYFTKLDLTGNAITRVDSAIDFDWSATPPDPTVNLPNFSARWTGRVAATFTENYTFYARANDGLRLSIDGHLLIDQWLDQPAAEHSATIDLKAGQLYDIQLDYYSKSSPASAQLSWSSPSTPRAIIPGTALYPAASFDCYSLLYKAAMLVGGFKMTVNEVAYLSAHGADFAGVDPFNNAATAPFDLGALPLHPFGFTVALFAQWERLYDLFALRDSLPQGQVGLLDVFGAPSLEAARGSLALATGWDSGEIEVLAGSMVDPATGVSIGFGLSGSDFKSEIMLLRLQACWALIKRLGISAKQLFNWAATEPDTAQAQDIRNTAKSKYDDRSWLTVVGPLNDVLRQSQRAALVAYLLTDKSIKDNNITDANGLYQYFLIDVNMGSCMMTSRIVQACSAIQLFVQRCLMNLENAKADPGLNVEPSAIDADQWRDWRKRYRFWEANRKVFLYPENWIEPELRDDKTPFFKELERDLLQNEIKQDTVEQAVLNYLEKLDDVARLDIRAMCWQKADSDDAADIVHVFGRTFNSPPFYYYRRFLAATRVWTPWEKVDLDIEGDHLIPATYNGRLYLFWPIFGEPKADKPQPVKESQQHKDWNAKKAAYDKAWQQYNDALAAWKEKHPDQA